ncbi:MAG: hypothetical protein H0V01_14225 [Bacteroidetes bacterium]|nr:hypothetical protein [Bacteroidota bacterium]HET6244703.1 hypothetical protein [Bacteroidia bacterium]
MTTKKLNTVLFLTLLFIVFPLFIQIGFGQPGPPGGGTQPCWPPSACIPIDGGLGFLMAAAVALGIKKIHDKKKTI